MMRSYKVNSNVSLHYIPMEKLKTTSIGVYIHRPLNDSEASMNALIPYVLKQGCKLGENTVEISNYLDNLYGASLSAGVIKKGEDHIIGFDAETISDRFAANGEHLLEELVKLLLSMMFEPVTENGAFKAEYVEREKKNLIDRIEGLINDKRSYARMRCIQEMCKGEAFAINRLGTKEGVEKITPHMLYDYYRKIISRSPIDIFVCGEADIEALSAAVKSVNLPFEKAEMPKTEILKKSGEVNNITERLDITQGKLSIGFRTNIKADDEDFIALTVANSVFGSGTHSKLFNNVREKLSLCYYASSSLDRFKGLMTVNAGIEFENYQKAYDEIFVQFEAVKKGEISDFEIESSINSLVNGYRSAYDDPSSMRGLYMSEILAGTGYSIADYIEKIKRVTKEDVIRVINKVETDTVYFLTGKEAE